MRYAHEQRINPEDVPWKQPLAVGTAAIPDGANTGIFFDFMDQSFSILSFLQNPVGFAEALAVFRPTACKTAFFNGCSFKTEVLKEPLFLSFSLFRRTKMKKNVFFAGILILLLVFGFVLSGCGDGAGTETETEELPAASGVNALSGKTYFDDRQKTSFSATADGVQSGTYTVSTVANGTYAANDKFAYTIDVETGAYTWNETAKTVSQKPERIALGGGSSGGSSGGSITIEHEYGPLQDKAEYRAEIVSWLSAYTDAEVQKQTGMTKTAYANYAVAEAFAIRKKNYAFSADNMALFLDETLPENKGSNELSGKTFTSQYNSAKTVAFTSTEYTVTVNSSQSETGTYAYDTSDVNDDDEKRVYLKPATLNGKDMSAYYTAITNTSAGHYATAADANAAQTNVAFEVRSERYNLTDRTIRY
jgi:hypothetical protein